LIDADKANPVIYLPLDQIVKNAQAKPPELPTEASSPAPPAAPAQPGASRSSGSASSGAGNGDANRSRDRGNR
jgi:hypothetical protein